ncbi:MAG: hypothetical protein LBT94_00435 [Prevotellaceae bacterium]|nr:hypothetical protein [Prevotellaceae bacterium]
MLRYARNDARRATAQGVLFVMFRPYGTARGVYTGRLFAGRFLAALGMTAGAGRKGARSVYTGRLFAGRFLAALGMTAGGGRGEERDASRRPDQPHSQPNFLKQNYLSSPRAPPHHLPNLI